tara:strand:- start:308 stop:673 length:366 start_codon:yes stop_codon:yes gene_type:complete
MGYLVQRSTDATVIDLLRTNGTGGTIDGTWGDSTKTTCLITSIMITASAASTVDLRLETSATTSADRYILDGLVMPASTTITIDTPIEFDRSTTDLVLELGSADDDVTIFVRYNETKKITI